MVRSLSIAAVVVLFVASSPVFGAAAGRRGLPEPVVPEGFGVNIHFVRTDEAEMDKLAALGVRFIRMDFAWGATERRRGEYDFAGYDALVANMAKRKIRCLFILDYANRLYDEGRPPHTEAGRKAFATWAAAAARRYAGKGVVWEIWNEPNLGQFWKPTPNAEDYCKLAHATIDAIRAADPEAFILGPASSGFPWDFFEVMAREGVFAKLDAVSVHPYRQKEPETAEADYHRLRLLLHRAVPGRVVPIVSGEWGYSTAWKGMDDTLQAKYVVRQWLMNLANDVHLSIWYDWRDDGLDPKEPEHHFGLVYRDFRDKPAAVEARKLCKTLDGYRFVRRVDTSWDHQLLFAKGDDAVVVMWFRGIFKASSGEEGPSAINYWRQQRLRPGTLSWAPRSAHVVVRAGEEAMVPIRIDGPDTLSGAKFRVYHVQGLEKKVLSEATARATDDPGVVHVPVRLPRADRVAEHVVIDRLVKGESGDWDCAHVTLLVANHMTASVLPPAGREVRVMIQNPSGEPQAFELRAKSGASEATTRVTIEKGRTEALAVVTMPAPVRGRVTVAGTRAGGTVVALESADWRPVPIDGGWRAHLDGDAKVEGRLNVEVADVPALPVAGEARGLKVDYQFGNGWRFANIVVPKEGRKVEGKPSAVGMWVHADGSKDQLRVRLKDKTGQMHQATSPSPLTWSGWRWVEIPVADAHHWGGANDGKLHEPLELDSIVIDNARQTTGKDHRVHLAGVALKYR